MKKNYINVPKAVRYLSEWPDFEHHITAPRAIIDKGVTGCGITQYYLLCDKPVVICEPRKQILRNKAEQMDRMGISYCFYEPSTCTGQKKEEENAERYQALLDHLDNHPCPKVLITYDSFANLCSVFCDRGILVVADEFHALMQDYKLKGNVVERFLMSLRSFEEVRFVSATPIPDNILKQVYDLKRAPFYKLIWSNPAPQTLHYHPMKSVEQAMSEIIARYRHDGFFDNVQDRTSSIKSKEGVFFINDVSKIIHVIKKNGLQASEVNILCADSDENKQHLKKEKLELGRIPLQGEPHKTYTFCTSAVFYGVDFRSSCASTYIFIFPGIDHLLLDPDLDIKQIIGRQRNDANPWKNQAHLYIANTNGGKIGAAEFRKQQTSKQHMTRQVVEDINTLMQSTFNAINIFMNDTTYGVVFQKPLIHQWRAKISTFAMYIESREWMLRNYVYASHETVKKHLSRQGFIILEAKAVGMKQLVQRELAKVLKVGETYTKSYLKYLLKGIYNNLGIRKNAKATDIERYYVAKPCRQRIKKEVKYSYKLFKIKSL